MTPTEPPVPVPAMPAPVIGPPPTTDDEPEGVSYLNSGRVRIRWDGVSYVLRRPRFGEYLEFREQLSQVDETASGHRGEPRFWRIQTDGIISVMDWLFRTLSDKRLPEGDARESCPAWLFTPQMTTTLIQHWQEHPLVPGNA